MPAPHHMTRGVLALLLPATLLASTFTAVLAPTASADTDTGAGPATTSSLRVTGRQRVRLEVLPSIVQPGRRVAAADAAATAVVATIRPIRRGRRVQLQALHGDTWQAVGTSRQGRRGRALFSAPLRAEGSAVTYRVKAFPSGRLRSLTSAPASTARWLDPTWSDEFSGDRLDPVWSHRGGDYADGSRRSCAKGDPRAVRVGGGVVRLSAILDPDTTKRCRIKGRDARRGRYAYRLNGHIGTEGAFSFRYGVAAARVRFHRLRGQHGAFWLQAPGGVYPGAEGTEIDVVEYFGDHHPNGGLATFMHRHDGRRKITTGGWIRNSRSYLTGRGDGWSRGYHVFSVEWTPHRLVFRIDGQETGRMRRGVSAVRQFPILSLIPANYEIPKIDERRLPQHMYVDWVRVWETEG